MFFINRYRRLKFISSRNNFQMQITISFLFSTLYRSRKIYQIPTLFQISRLQMAKNYRPRNCYQSATCNQSPKSEFLSTANRYQMLQFIKRELVSFLFFVVLGNELRYEKMPNFVRLLIARRQRRSECESPEFAGVRQFFMTAC